MMENNNNFVGNNKDITRDMLKNKQVSDIRYVGGNAYQPMEKTMDSVDALLPYYESRLGNQSIHKILNMGDDELSFPTLMGKIDGSNAINNELVILRDELKQYVDSVKYDKASQAIKNAKAGFNALLEVKQAEIQSWQTTYNQLDDYNGKYGNWMTAKERHDMDKQKQMLMSFIENPASNAKIAEIDVKMQKYQMEYIKAICKCRMIEEIYQEELKIIEAERRLDDLRRGNI